jgi:hypothetical protein
MTDQPTPRPVRCKRCGLDHDRCLAHNQQGGPCGENPLAGQDVCHKHGGKTPVALVAAEGRVQRANAIRAVQHFGLPIDIDPAEALRQEIARTQGAVIWLQAHIATLDLRDIERGLEAAEQTTIPDETAETGRRVVSARTMRRSAPSVWVRLWQDERRHLADVCVRAIACGLAEREVRLAEEQGRLMADIFRRLEADSTIPWTPEALTAFRASTIRELGAPIALTAGAP